MNTQITQSASKKADSWPTSVIISGLSGITRDDTKCQEHDETTTHLRTIIVDPQVVWVIGKCFLSAESAIVLLFRLTITTW
jgi:hypothetical protein